MEKLLEILKEMKPGVDFEKEKHLISDGVITSMEIVRLIMDISDAYDITISPLYIVPENFESVEAIYQLIERCEEE